MNLQQIKDKLSAGIKVYWNNEAHEVTQDNKSQYFITNIYNQYSVGLTWLDGITLNGKESEFFTK